MAKNIFVVDVDRCIRCKGCQVACKLENEIALGSYRNSVNVVGPTGTYPDLELYFLPTMCQECENPPCAEVCPTGACYKNAEDGVILIDPDKCISCMACKKACPYDVNTYNKELHVMDKCTMCVQLRAIGEKPACVKNCPGSALIFGDIEDPDSDVSRALKAEKSENIHTLRDFGNGPSTRYILRKAKWLDVLPNECSPQKGRNI
ncbi:4Fe-4S dicluster domain-containing protein [Parasporobacterium paucivorans]|uniref:[NiFe]-hydrogenase II apoprotein, ferredoxin-type subunit n=1 Tax=Parasporobacterium paucivorans DSM 15970 TaxID=1122934 RepID=A0A1M6E7M7_9FIRM|nr:4Fe-4S dicluster domain-containing protein [Parasporobacterium paucivorans]SHI81389.1 [NiFe]-hydrogenase II apoprotein, ferredoxin-type subunit [Parasporobacterium paucivorans DSM 15970]